MQTYNVANWSAFRWTRFNWSGEPHRSAFIGVSVRALLCVIEKKNQQHEFA